MAKKEEKKRPDGNKPPPKKKRASTANPQKKRIKQGNAPAPSISISDRFVIPDFQRKAGLTLIAASLILVASAGAWLGPDPLSGALHWLGRGFIQASYAALLALFLWMVLGRRRGIAYLLLLGFVCSGVAIWDTAAGIYASRLRLEANNILATFRDKPLNAVGLSGIIERNPYVDAYMVMRDVYWGLHNRLDGRMTDYSTAYGAYVKSGQFLDVARLKSRYELWRAYYQVEDLERLLARIEADPANTDDLPWTVNLLDVDPWTKNAYANDLEKAISSAYKSQMELLDRERTTLARIKHSLKVLIDAEGRYHFAKERVVFDNPADAARFAGMEQPPN